MKITAPAMEITISLSGSEFKSLADMADAARCYFNDKGNGQYTASERARIEELTRAIFDWNPMSDLE